MSACAMIELAIVIVITITTWLRLRHINRMAKQRERVTNSLLEALESGNVAANADYWLRNVDCFARFRWGVLSTENNSKRSTA